MQDWAFDPVGPKARVKRSGLPHERLVTFMANRRPGRTYMNVIGREFGLKAHQRKDLQKTLRDDNHATTLALKALGVTYGSEDNGRGAKSYLVKAAQQDRPHPRYPAHIDAKGRNGYGPIARAVSAPPKHRHIR